MAEPIAAVDGESYGGFTLFIDADSGDSYFVEASTEATSWDEPPAFTAARAKAAAVARRRPPAPARPADAAAATAAAAAAALAAAVAEWEQVEQDGQTYFFNSRTEDTAWELPPDIAAARAAAAPAGAAAAPAAAAPAAAAEAATLTSPPPSAEELSVAAQLSLELAELAAAARGAAASTSAARDACAAVGAFVLARAGAGAAARPHVARAVSEAGAVSALAAALQRARAERGAALACLQALEAVLSHCAAAAGADDEKGLPADAVLDLEAALGAGALPRSCVGVFARFKDDAELCASAAGCLLLVAESGCDDSAAADARRASVWNAATAAPLIAVLVRHGTGAGAGAGGAAQLAAENAAAALFFASGFVGGIEGRDRVQSLVDAGLVAALAGAAAATPRSRQLARMLRLFALQLLDLHLSDGAAALLRGAVACAAAVGDRGEEAGRLLLLLLQALPKAGSPERRAVRASARAAPALQHAHAAPFASRDLRVDEDGGTCAACRRPVLVTRHTCASCAYALCLLCHEELRGPV